MRINGVSYNPALYSTSVKMKAVPRHEIFCPHCNSMLPKSTYYRHRRLYYNVTSQRWNSANGGNFNGEEWNPEFSEEHGTACAPNCVEETWNIEDFTSNCDISDPETDSCEVELPQGFLPQGEL